MLASRRIAPVRRLRCHEWMSGELLDYLVDDASIDVDADILRRVS